MRRYEVAGRLAPTPGPSPSSQRPGSTATAAARVYAQRHRSAVVVAARALDAGGEEPRLLQRLAVHAKVDDEDDRHRDVEGADDGEGDVAELLRHLAAERP